jgi:hypothetical protein
MDDGRTLKWFHTKVLKKSITYGYFIKQLNFPDCMQDDVKKAIQKFNKEH